MTTMRVTPTVAMDWLVRALLPGLLVVAAGRFASSESVLRVQGAELADRLPLASGADRYELSHLVSSLTRVEETLKTAFQVESRRARGWVGTVASFGGPVRFRGTFFPELDQITELVARTVTVRGAGELARSCVNGAIAVAMLRADEATMSADVPPLTTVRPLLEAYERSLRVLTAQCGAPVTPVGDDRFQALRSRRANGGKGFRGVFHSPDGPVSCPHVHKEPAAARRCARRLPARLGVAA